MCPTFFKIGDFGWNCTHSSFALDGVELSASHPIYFNLGKESLISIVYQMKPDGAQIY
jgi:hypothetical protein